ncbi:MAG TPA: hypothetical protein VGX37_01560 [Allosphingosinicella sp.]|jgi:hypothetical protein|nr:hypothetical protein [Allosphingosinicella sp.]
MSAIRVGIITDWKRSSRASKWSLFLNQNHKTFPTQVTEFPVADRIVEPPGAEKPEDLQHIRDQDVVVINWDSVNGDPDFGAHLALRWLEHRFPEILIWVREGNVLIVESQAVYGVPCQAAYDAVAGKGELAVSGPPDRQNPAKVKDRLGATCRKTRAFPKKGRFENVETLAASGHLQHSDMFPGTATDILTPQLKEIDWGKVLYRGWFRRKIFRGTEYPWVSIVETANRPRWRNHSVMQVARIGDGAIFAATMMLATTGQARLVLAMLNCARGNTDHLPLPGSWLERLRSSWRLVVTLGAGAFAAYLTGEDVARGLTWINPNWAPPILKALLIPAGAIVFEIGWRLFAGVKAWWRDFIGY